MVRRVLGAVAGGIAVAAMLSGCLFAYDATKPVMHFTNASSQDVVVIVEGWSDDFPRVVASPSSYREVIDECAGTAIRVETENGALLGRVDAQACPDWTLTIDEDGTLDYVED